jgi:adenylate kinase
MRLVLFGPPGAGKGTQARLLADRFDLTQISTGDLFRAALQKETQVGLEARAYMDRGSLVPDSVVNRMVAERLAELDHADFILDGFPRTIPQAEWLRDHLEKEGAPLSAVISLKVDTEQIVRRLSRRRCDPETGEIYHLDFNPPPPELPEERLLQRADDRPEAVRNRLEEYEDKTRPLEAYFREHATFLEIDGEGGIEEVHRRIVAALKETHVHQPGPLP